LFPNVRGITPQILVSIIAILAGFVVILVVVFPAVRDVLIGSSEKSECRFSVLLSSIGRQAGLSIPASCKMKRMNIGLSDLEPIVPLAKKRIESYKSADYAISTGGSASDHFKPREKDYYKWSLMRLVSDELVDCFDKGWRGELELDPRIWTNVYSRAFEGRKAGHYICILCSRMVFGDDVKSLFSEPEIKRGFLLAPFMEVEKVEGKSYMNFLSEGVREDWKYKLQYAGFTLDEPWAVLFVADPFTKEGKLSGVVQLAEYDKITTDLGGTEKKYASGIIPGVERRERCAVIIGD
ncbi:hypothetical protein D6825_01360, partial [Candidatus Woesearchaeota archaeon]